MNVLFFCPLWGSEQMEFYDFCAKAAGEGYDGIELALPLDDQPGTDSILQALDKHNLKLLAQHWESADPDIETHLDMYRRRLEWQAEAKPEFINSQTGRDWFSFEHNQLIIDAAREVAEKTGVKIVHETHRGKATFCATTTRSFLEANPDMRLTADFSHWCNVSESLLEDQGDAVAAAAQRAEHIHARVGHPEGPQVNDPRAPEWEDALNAHLAWWDAIYKARTDAGEPLSVTCEFGPDPYMPAKPYTQEPLADQWEVNVYMMNLLKDRWNR